jgi:two-component system sensor histidine kinase YesM
MVSGIKKPAVTKRFNSLITGVGIKKTIKTSHIVIITVMLIPLLLSVIVSVYNTYSYDRLITNVSKTRRLTQIVKTDISHELWDIVTGNKSFSAGKQYEIIQDINDRLRDIMSTTAARENRNLLEVAGRAINTLTRYVDRMGFQMENSYPVIDNERILDEIRGTALLVSEILQDFIALEIDSAAAENENIKKRVFIIAAVELATMLFVTAFSVIVQVSVASSVDKAIGALASLSGRIAEGDLDARAEVPAVKELSALTEDLNIMAGKIKNLMAANIREQRNRQKSEMKALQAQITPHFLYNTLDSIVWLAEGSHYEEVISITRALSNFFRIALNRGDEWVSVQDEFKHIESYLIIQKIRYRDILDYTINYEPVMAGKTILKLLLQPLVENALYHGIKNKRGRGSIVVRGWPEAGYLRFSVEDNGIGMTEERIKEISRHLGSSSSTEPLVSGYGFYNVGRRLELYYNRKDLLEITSVYRKGTTVILRIPEAAPNV